MKISELIAELEKAMAEHGDLEVHASRPIIQRWWLDRDEQPPFVCVGPRLGEAGYRSPMGTR